MSRNRVFVEIDTDGIPIRIFKNWSIACRSEAFDKDKVKEWPRVEAVSCIRKFVLQRAESCCEMCGELLTSKSGEMDERIPKGQGGEVSIYNCWWLCHDCHQKGPFSKHGRVLGGRKKIN